MSCQFHESDYSSQTVISFLEFKLTNLNVLNFCLYTLKQFYSEYWASLAPRFLRHEFSSILYHFQLKELDLVHLSLQVWYYAQEVLQPRSFVSHMTHRSISWNSAPVAAGISWNSTIMAAGILDTSHRNFHTWLKLWNHHSLFMLRQTKWMGLGIRTTVWV